MLNDQFLSHVAKTAIVNEEGKILVLTRSASDKKRPGGLDFPGGNLDPGEDVLEGAVREIEEESGIKLGVGDLKIIHTSTNNHENDVVIRFLCIAKVINPDVKLSFEHSNYQWMTLEEILESFEEISWAKGLRYGLQHGILTNNLQ